MSADGGHFEPRSGSLNTILEVDHLRTIDDMFVKQTWDEWSLGGQLSKLCPVTPTSIQDGNHQRNVPYDDDKYALFRR
jgi:hypothetical protein